MKKGKNEHTGQCTHVQNHAYANKSRHTYARNARQLLNPVLLMILALKLQIIFSLSIKRTYIQDLERNLF